MRFNIINRDSIKRAKIGDTFTGYGINGTDVIMDYKAADNDSIYALFYELKKDKTKSKYYIDFSASPISSSLSKRHRLV